MENMSKRNRQLPTGRGRELCQGPKCSAGLWEEAVPLASIPVQSHLPFPGFGSSEGCP